MANNTTSSATDDRLGSPFFQSGNETELMKEVTCYDDTQEGATKDNIWQLSF
jgi:hypothetical protein